MPDNGELLTVAELAKLMGLSGNTVRIYSTQWPERLPPRVSWSSKPLWDRHVARLWLEVRSGMVATVEPQRDPAPNVERPPRVVKAGRPRRADI